MQINFGLIFFVVFSFFLIINFKSWLNMNKTEVIVFGLSTTSTSAGGYALILKDINSNKRVPIIIGGAEAHAIALELEGYSVPRPLTHDLLKNVITALGGIVIEVNIIDLRDNTFFANIIIEQSGLNIEIDARPSDAIALALRTNSPIYIYDNVLNQVAFEPPEIDENELNNNSPRANNEYDNEEDDFFNISDNNKATYPFEHEKQFNNSNPNRQTTKEEDEKAFLENQLREAIEKEDYERAAIIRDKLKKFSNK